MTTGLRFSYCIFLDHCNNSPCRYLGISTIGIKTMMLYLFNDQRVKLTLIHKYNQRQRRLTTFHITKAKKWLTAIVRGLYIFLHVFKYTSHFDFFLLANFAN